MNFQIAHHDNYWNIIEMLIKSLRILHVEGIL